MTKYMNRDYLTISGALELARRIEAYWAKQAPPDHQRVVCSVQTAIYRARSDSTDRSVGWVRSNLIDGWPPR
jgi:hypothetical protein